MGDAGAPVEKKEIPILKKAWLEVRNEVRPRAREVVQEKGLIQGNEKEGYELTCTDNEECVFVTYTEDKIAICSIQKAFQEGRIAWPKPISCHLFPVRITSIAGFDYANFQYVPTLCAPAVAQGKKEGYYLSDFLETPFLRKYGADWVEDFKEACRQMRALSEEEKSC